MDFTYYDENLGLNIQVKSNSNELIFINEDIGIKVNYLDLQEEIENLINDGVYEQFNDIIGDYNIPDEIEEMKQNISNEETFEIEYYDNEITEDFNIANTEELAKNYVYNDEHNLYEGGVKTRSKKNIEIIKLLKGIEQENRQATSEEQIILAGYNGFGGLANVLTPNKVGFEEEYNAFKIY